MRIKYNIIIALIAYFGMFLNDLSFAQDSLTVPIGKNTTFGIMDMDFGTIIRAGDKANTGQILEPKPFLGAGIGAGVEYKHTFGAFCATTFYTDGELISMIIETGLLFKHKWGLAVGYDCGRVKNIHEDEWKNRLCVRVSYKLGTLTGGK